MWIRREARREGEEMNKIKSKPNIIAVMTYITVEMAIAFLETNVINRPLTPARVKELADVMRLDLYMTTHQGIAFDVNGILIDGQHRLSAIIESGLPQWIFVFTGLHPNCRLAIDNGKVRTPIGISRIVGRIGDSTQAYSIVRKLQFGIVPGSQSHVNEQVLFGLVDKFEEGISFLYTCKGGLNLNSVIATVIVRAYYSGIDHSKLRRFCEILSGDSCSKEEMSAQRLRELLIRSRSGDSWLKSGTIKRNRTVYIYNSAETALHAFVHGKELKVLRQTSTELFKLPKHLNP